MNRVAGFMCRYVLNGHYGCSPGLAVVERTSGPGYSTTYLVLYIYMIIMIFRMNTYVSTFIPSSK